MCVGWERSLTLGLVLIAMRSLHHEKKEDCFPDSNATPALLQKPPRGHPPVLLAYSRILAMMPYSDNPDDLPLPPVEEAVRIHNKLAIGLGRKLGKRCARIRESLQSGERFLCGGYKRIRRLAPLLKEARDGVKKLLASCGCEANIQGSPSQHGTGIRKHGFHGVSRVLRDLLLALGEQIE